MCVVCVCVCVCVIESVCLVLGCWVVGVFFFLFDIVICLQKKGKQKGRVKKGGKRRGGGGTYAFPIESLR